MAQRDAACGAPSGSWRTPRAAGRPPRRRTGPGQSPAKPPSSLGRAVELPAPARDCAGESADRRAAALKLTDNLLLLERGADELLLTNTVNRRPLYIKKGATYIKAFLTAVGRLRLRSEILRTHPQDRDLLRVLLDYQIVVPEGSAAEAGRLRRLECLPPPGGKRTLSLYLLLSHSCNLQCVYCLDGRATYQTDRNLRMSRAVAFRSIDRSLDELAPGGRLEIVFFGGEPLLNWPLAKEIIVHCEEALRERHRGKTRQYHFTSNLSQLPPDLIEWARKYEISFLCDVDGPAEIHDRSRRFRSGGGTYAAIARNIGRLRAAGLKVDLRATVTALNQDCLPEVSALHRALGGASSALCAVNPVNSDESILPEDLLPAPEQLIAGVTAVHRSGLWEPANFYPVNLHASRLAPGSLAVVGCGAPFGNVPVVTANGDVYACIYLVGIPRFLLGNILEPDYPRRPVLEAMYASLHVDHRDDCRACPRRYLCGGGCPVGRLSVSGNARASPAVKAYCEKIACDFTRGVLDLLLWERADATASAGAAVPAATIPCA